MRGWLSIGICESFQREVTGGRRVEKTRQLGKSMGNKFGKRKQRDGLNGGSTGDSEKSFHLHSSLATQWPLDPGHCVVSRGEGGGGGGAGRKLRLQINKVKSEQEDVCRFHAEEEEDSMILN